MLENRDLSQAGPAFEEENGGLSYFLINPAWLYKLLEGSESTPGMIINEPIARKIHEQRVNANGSKNHYYAHDNAVELREPDDI